MFARQAAGALALLLVAGCGGSGGSGASSAPTIGTATGTPGAGSSAGQGTSGSRSASIAANVSSLSVSASTAQSAPTASISITAQISGAGEIYVGIEAPTTTIASVSGEGGYAADFTITFKSPAPFGAGTYHDTMTVYGCYDPACTQQVSNSPLTIPVTYTVTLAPPQVTSISPTATPAGGSALTLQVDGTGFTPQSVIEWNGTPLQTQFASPIELDAQLSSADVAMADVAAITVANSVSSSDPGAPGSSATFTVTGVSPDRVAADGPKFLLTVIGQGFTSSSVVQWNGSSRPTTFVSANVLRAQIGASDIAAAGTASVSVQNAGRAGSMVGSVSIESMPAPKDSVAFQINPQHSGSISFDSLSFPTGATWSVDVGGNPSYALIADGKVFVTTRTIGGTQPQGTLVALDQATGATAWGPIALSGNLTAAYDNGSVFVSTGSQVQAYNAQTGAAEWSASAPAGSAYTSVVAANGLVVAVSDPNSSSTSAFNEDTGLILWRLRVFSGVYPTVTTDGIYLSGVGVTLDVDPATGDIIWQNQPAYSNSHDSIAVATNGVLYSLDTAEFGSDNGTELDAASGSVLGGFNAYYPPSIGAQTGYFLEGNALQGGTLSAVDLGTGTALWTFTGDGQLMSPPILVNGYVFIGSSSGTVYALDGSSGTVVWQQNVGAAIAAGPGWGIDVPASGLSAGDGLLVVPAGTKVTAYTLSTNP